MTRTMRELLEQEVQDLVSAEDQLQAALPGMIKAASNPDLRRVLQRHYQLKREHQIRLRVVTSELGMESQRVVCHGMSCILAEGARALEAAESEIVRDALLVALAQKVAQYELAVYGAAGLHAQRVGEYDVVELLERTRKEESEVASTLSDLSNEAGASLER